ncbi:hypothetical protein KAR91_28480 [Candidatus Pacearchaeota archaeon]|nr:hypothetical protein [Candidatus Pacearchaeota archaeon]
MRIAVSGKGTYNLRQTLKGHKLRWYREKHAWVGNVERLTVTLIREYMKQYKNVKLTFESPEEEEEYYGWPRWVCKCNNVIRKEDCQHVSGDVFRCPFCQANTRLLEE